MLTPPPCQVHQFAKPPLYIVKLLNQSRNIFFVFQMYSLFQLPSSDGDGMGAFQRFWRKIITDVIINYLFKTLFVEARQGLVNIESVKLNIISCTLLALRCIQHVHVKYLCAQYQGCLLLVNIFPFRLPNNDYI